MFNTVQRMAKYENALVQQYDGAFDHFLAALAQAFDVCPYIVAQVANMDYLRNPIRATLASGALLNGAQSLTYGGEASDPLAEVLSFLVSHSEPDYSEPYEHSERDKVRIRTALVAIATTHDTAAAYFTSVSRRLWCPPDYMTSHYKWYQEKLQKRIDAYRQGQAFVFSHMRDNGKPVFIQ